MSLSPISPQLDKDRRQHVYVLMMESFVKRWSPHDRHDNAQFHAEFYALIRQIYEDAVEPWRSQLDRVVEAYASRTLSTLIMKEPGK